jgi:hypothetical protein
MMILLMCLYTTKLQATRLDWYHTTNLRTHYSQWVQRPVQLFESIISLIPILLFTTHWSGGFSYPLRGIAVAVAISITI